MSGIGSGAAPNILLLGIGNVLWADEGFGVRVIEDIAAHYQFAPNVRVLDGGTQGIYLVDQVCWADVLIIFDAVDYGLPPGALKLVEDRDVPSFLGAKKMSLHQTGFQEVLAMAELLGDAPQHLYLIGVQPAELEDFGGSLGVAVKSQIPAAIRAAQDYSARFEVQWVPIEDGVNPQATDIPHPSLNMLPYETGRPSETDACRIGDVRVLERCWAKKTTLRADH